MVTSQDERAIQLYKTVALDMPMHYGRFQTFDSDLAIVGALNLYDYVCPGVWTIARSYPADALVNGAVAREGELASDSVRFAAAERLNRVVHEVLCNPAGRKAYDDYLLWVAAHHVAVQFLAPARAPLSSTERRQAVSALTIATEDANTAEAIVAGFEAVCAGRSGVTGFGQAGGEGRGFATPAAATVGPNVKPAGPPATMPGYGPAIPAGGGGAPATSHGADPMPKPKPATSSKRNGIIIGVAVCAALALYAFLSLPPKAPTSNAEPSRSLIATDGSMSSEVETSGGSDDALTFMSDESDDAANGDASTSSESTRFGTVANGVFTCEKHGFKVTPNERVEFEGSYTDEKKELWLSAYYTLHDDEGEYVGTGSVQVMDGSYDAKMWFGDDGASAMTVNIAGLPFLGEDESDGKYLDESLSKYEYVYVDQGLIALVSVVYDKGTGGNEVFLDAFSAA